MVRWPKCLLFVALLLPAASHAQRRDSVERRIASLEDSWIQAVIRRDARAFDRLLGAGFVYTENERLYTRAELLKEVTSGADTVTSGRNEDLVVRASGNTAIATGWLVLIGRSAGKPFERRYRYTDTWQRLNGRWQIIAAQDYLKP